MGFMCRIYWNITIIALSLIFASTIKAQAPDTLWTLTLGGNAHDYGVWIKQTSDGGYIVVGRTESFGAGSSDVYLIKLNEIGDTTWTRTYGGDGWDSGSWVEQKPDNGYIIVGQTTSFGSGDGDVYLIRTDSYGDTLWTKAFGGENNDAGISAQLTLDGGLIITGFTSSYGEGSFDIYLIRTDINGDSVWTRTYGGSDADIGTSILETPDGGYIIAGWAYLADNDTMSTCLVIRTNQSGDTLWTNYINGMVGFTLAKIAATLDGNYIIFYSHWYYNEEEIDYRLIKINPDGDTLWTRQSGINGNDIGYSIEQTTDQGFILCGLVDTTYTSDILIVKTDSLGGIVWQKIINGPFQYPYLQDDEAYCIHQTTDAGYILTGFMNFAQYGNNQVYICKLSPDQVGLEDGRMVIQDYSLPQNCPNPFNWQTRITFNLPQPLQVNLDIFDLGGRKVANLLNQQMPAGSHSIIWDAKDFASGIYFYRLQAGEYRDSRKMILVK